MLTLGQGSFTCQCHVGFEGNLCTDIDECLDNTVKCDTNARCINLGLNVKTALELAFQTCQLYNMNITYIQQLFDISIPFETVISNVAANKVTMVTDFRAPGVS